MKPPPVASRRPKVLANIAVTVDGKIPTGFQSHDIHSSKATKRRIAIIRARGDAVLSASVSRGSKSPALLLKATRNTNPLTRDFLLSPKFRSIHTGAIPMPILLEMLSTIWGVKTLVCEVGLPILKSLLEADFVDELYMTILPLVCGDSKSPGLTGMPRGFLRNERKFRLKSLKQSADKVYLHYIRDRKSS